MFDNMKKVYIYLNGEYYKQEKQIRYRYYLSYKDCVLRKTGYVNEAGSHNRAELHSLYMALQELKEPCMIYVVSKYPLNLDKAVGSFNKDLISEIILTIKRVGHIVNFETDKKLEQISKFEEQHKKMKKQDKKMFV